MDKKVEDYPWIGKCAETHVGFSMDKKVEDYPWIGKCAEARGLLSMDRKVCQELL